MELHSWQALGKDYRGSRPRCVSLVEGSRESVATTLTNLIDCQDVAVNASDHWMPYGKPIKQATDWDTGPAREARIDRDSDFVSHDVQKIFGDGG